MLFLFIFTACFVLDCFTISCFWLTRVEIFGFFVNVLLNKCFLF